MTKSTHATHKSCHFRAVNCEYESFVVNNFQLSLEQVDAHFRVGDQKRKGIKPKEAYILNQFYNRASKCILLPYQGNIAT